MGSLISVREVKGGEALCGSDGLLSFWLLTASGRSQEPSQRALTQSEKGGMGPMSTWIWELLLALGSVPTEGEEKREGNIYGAPSLLQHP